jgi:hypothetical protein
MHITGKHFTLLLAVELPTLGPGSLVPRTQHLDRGDESLIVGQGSDFDEALDDFVGAHGDKNPLTDSGDISRWQQPIKGRANLTDQ